MLLTNAETRLVKTPKNATRLRVLVLCTGNSARSIMAEAIFNSVGAPLFQAFSAGSRPVGRVNPLALEQIKRLDLNKEGVLHSKSWNAFTKPEAPKIDLVLTVCDNAASETCPAFAGNYEHIHWGLRDPAGFSRDVDIERSAFSGCFNEILSRVEVMVSNYSPTDAYEDIVEAMKALG